MSSVLSTFVKIPENHYAIIAMIAQWFSGILTQAAKSDVITCRICFSLMYSPFAKAASQFNIQITSIISMPKTVEKSMVPSVSELDAIDWRLPEPARRRY